MLLEGDADDLEELLFPEFLFIEGVELVEVGLCVEGLEVEGVAELPSLLGVEGCTVPDPDERCTTLGRLGCCGLGAGVGAGAVLW